MNQFSHIKYIVQGQPANGKYEWRVVAASGILMKDGFKNRNDAEAYAAGLPK